MFVLCLITMSKIAFVYAAISPVSFGGLSSVTSLVTHRCRLLRFLVSFLVLGNGYSLISSVFLVVLLGIFLFIQ